MSAVLSARALTKSFGGLVAVADLDLDVAPSEIVGLIGPNGAGKSTTFNMISGFMKPTRGTLHLFGRDVTGQSVRAISRLGLVRTFQHGGVMPTMTVAKNILLGTLHAARDVGRAGRAARIDRIADLLGLAAHCDTPVGTLPHGLQRLVSIAIALAAEPKLLCLDEPLTGLNEAEVRQTLDVLQRLKGEDGRSILLVEHNMKAVMSICERIVVLHHGRRIAAGAPQEIRNDPAVIESYLGSASP